MLKITQDRRLLNMATKKLDRALEKINSNKAVLIVSDRGDTIVYRIFSYSGNISRVRVDNEYTGKKCRCDADGNIFIKSQSPIVINWECCIAQSMLSPYPTIDIHVPCCEMLPTMARLMDMDGILRAPDVTEKLCGELFCTGRDTDWHDVLSYNILFSSEVSSDMLLTVLNKKHKTPRVLEILGKSFKLPRKEMLGEVKLIGCDYAAEGH